MTTTNLMNSTAILRNVAQQLRGRDSIPRIKYAKGEWSIDKVKINGRELGARPDWVFRGWTRWWDKQPTYFFGGYLLDKWVPPSRETLPDKDKDDWQIYCNGRDPWALAYHLPLFDVATAELFIWSTDTAGGESAITALLNAFCDRCDMQPEDGTILPIVALNTSGYNHPVHNGFVHTPQPDIVNWTKPPSTPRPVLSSAAPPPSEPPAQMSLLLPDAPRTAGGRNGDGEIPFAPEWR